MKFIHAGAGIVYDSIPESEHQECLNKTAALMRALKKKSTCKGADDVVH